MEDLINSVFDDEPSTLGLTFMDIAGGCWLLSDSIHEMCEMLRTTRLKVRLSCEAFTSEAWKRFYIVKYPPAVCK